MSYTITPVDHFTEDRIAETKKIIAESDGPVLVVYETTPECQTLLKAIKNSAMFKGTEGMAKRWNKGAIPVMLIHPLRASGCNLSDGGHTLIWFGVPSGVAHYEQTNNRLLHVNQANDVTIHHVIDSTVPVDPKWEVRLHVNTMPVENTDTEGE